MSLRLTYLGQEEARRVVLHQEGLGAHVDSDVYLLALFSVGAVLLVDAQDPTPAVIHRAEEATLTWCADPVVTAGIHRALDDAVIKYTAKNSRRNESQGTEDMNIHLSESRVSAMFLLESKTDH